MSMAAPMTRQWRLDDTDAYCLVDIETRSARAEVKEEEKAEVEASGTLSVYLLTESRVLSIPCKSGERILRVRGAVAKEIGVKSGEVVLLYNGDKVEDAFPLTRILEGTGKLGAAVTLVKPLLLSTTKVGSDVQISPDRKSISSTDEDYCSNTAHALSEHPIPNSGVFRFGLEIGEEMGCYDFFGFAPENHDMNEMVGSNEDSWCVQLCYRRCYHNGTYNRFEISMWFKAKDKIQVTVDRGAGTVDILRPKDGVEIKGAVSDLATGPLHLALGVCPHDGATSLTIIDFDAAAN